MKIIGDRCTTMEKPNYKSRRWAQSRMNRCAKLGPAQHQLFKKLPTPRHRTRSPPIESLHLYETTSSLSQLMNRINLINYN